MLGGLAAGLGLAWLAHSLGLGEAFGNVLMVMLLAMAAMAVIGMIMLLSSSTTRKRWVTMPPLALGRANLPRLTLEAR
mgnify:CR=1 FL=1